MNIQSQILSLSMALISVPSVSGNTEQLKRVIGIVKNELKEIPYEEFEKDGIPSILFYNGKKRPKKFTVLLNGHLDVVPAKSEQFHPTVKNGKLYGRGSYDMKSAVAVMTLLYKELAHTVTFPLGLQLVADEEVGGARGTGHQMTQGVACEFAIAGENTNFMIKNEAKGIFWIKLTATGVRAHGAYPWKGDNAIWKLLYALQKLEKVFPVTKKEVWKTTINLSRIETPNSTFNTIPDEATAWLDVRYVPKEKEKFLRELHSAAKGLKIEFVSTQPAAFTSESNAYVKLLQHALNKIHPEKLEKFTWHGASDVRFFTEKGMHGVEFGPIGADHHSDNEWVDIQSLVGFYKILEEFLKSVS